MTARSFATTVVFFFATMSVALSGTAIAAASTAQQDGDREVLVAVVRTPTQNGGVSDSLAQIAARNLGTAERVQEIFDLNKGRRQVDGSALTDGTVRPGWILILPEDARGPDVRTAVLGGSEAVPTENGDGADVEQTEEASGASGGNASAAGLRWPILLAVLGGLGVAALTTAIVMRKRIQVNLGRLRAAASALRKWLIARRRRRILLRTRTDLITAWAYDSWAPVTAQKALADHQTIPAPVAVSVRDTGATVLGGPPETMVGQHGASTERQRGPSTVQLRRRTPIRPVVRIGGDAVEQVFVDLSQCRGVLNIDGDPAIALDVAYSLLIQLGQTSPELVILSLGSAPLLQGTPVATLDDLQRFGLPPAEKTVPLGLVNAFNPPSELVGVLLVQPGHPQAELEDAMARCAHPNSGWILIYPGKVDGAHWRWTAKKDGRLVVPILDRTIAATGTGPASRIPTAQLGY